jgi:hypothetical protein
MSRGLYWGNDFAFDAAVSCRGCACLPVHLGDLLDREGVSVDMINWRPQCSRAGMEDEALEARRPLSADERERGRLRFALIADWTGWFRGGLLYGGIMASHHELEHIS